MPNRNLYARIQDGEYKSKLPYGTKPVRPPLLNKRVHEMTNAEIAAIPQMVAEYEQACKDADAASALYRKDQARLDQQFRDDLEAEYEMKGHPKADKLYGKAYEMGHSAGYSEIAIFYGDLVDLVKD